MPDQTSTTAVWFPTRPALGSDPRRDDVCSYIVQRTQIYLDEEQQRRLTARSRSTGRTKSDLIREAVDAFLDEGLDTIDELAAFRSVVELGAGSISRLPSGSDYVDELRGEDERRQQELEARGAAP